VDLKGFLDAGLRRHDDKKDLFRAALDSSMKIAAEKIDITAPKPRSIIAC
jgi:hypothetical protein